MNTTNLEKRRCRCDVLITKEAQNLKENRGSCMDWYLRRDSQSQHEVAAKHTCSAGETDRLKGNGAYMAQSQTGENNDSKGREG